MRIQTKIKNVKNKQSFFMMQSCYNSTYNEYVKYPSLHNNCYDKIDGVCFGFGVDGPNKNHICAFKENDLVDIDVESTTFKEIYVGTKFTNGTDKYTKIRDGLINDKYYALSEKGAVYPFSDDEIIAVI